MDVRTDETYQLAHDGDEVSAHVAEVCERELIARLDRP
jgi:hypothetical protein